jgi:hypothetical protein
VSSRHDGPGRGRETIGQEAGAGIAIGAAVGGLAGLLWAVYRNKKKPLAGEEESPIIIKSGSLSLGVRDGANGKITGKDSHYEVTSDDFTRMTKWDVSVAELAAGYPWKTPTDLTNVSSVVLAVVDDNQTSIDTITITFVNEVLTVTAVNDNKFGKKTKVTDPAKSKSKTHKLRAIHKDIKGEKDFEIASITINDGSTPPPEFGPGFDYALRFTFRP